MAYIPSECSLEEYEEVIYSGDAKNRLYVKHGDTIIGTNGDNNASPFASKLTVKRRILKNGSKTITLNNFISQEIDLVLHDYKIEDLSEEIEIKIGTFIDKVNDYVYVPLGKFLIQDNPTTDKDKTTYKLRDFSVKFDFYYNGKPLIDANGGSATKMQILQDICKQAGVVCKINSFTGYNEKIGIYDNSVTARTYIAYLAEQAGKMASINRYGELVFVDITSDDKTATGEKSIIINDALEKRMNSLVVEGKSEQEVSVQGKNYYTGNKFTNGTGLGITYTFDNSIIKLNGTTTGSGTFYEASTKIKVPAGTYSYALGLKSGTFTTNDKDIAIYLRSATDFITGAYSTSGHSLKAIESSTIKRPRRTITISEDIELYIRLYTNGSGVICENVELELQLEAGSTSTDFEQFIPNSPSPDYPSEIKTVKGIENLFEVSDDTKPTANVSYTKLTDNSFKISATRNTTTNWSGYVEVPINIKNIEPNTTYTLSKIHTIDGTSFTRIGGVRTRINGTYNTIYTTNKITFTTPENLQSLSLVFYIAYNDTQTGNSTIVFENIQLEKGSTAHPFVPYGSRYLYNKIYGKNLFDYITNFNSSISGITNTINSDGSITVSGIPDYNYVSIVPRYDITDRLIDGEEYTISQSANSGAVGIEVRAINKISGAITYYQHNKTFRVDLNLYTYNIVLFTGTLSSWGTEERTITGFYQLERGSIATEFEPYKEKIITYDLKKKNLFDSDIELGSWHSGSGLPNNVTNAIRSANIILVDPNTTYTIKNDKDYNFFVQCFDESENYLSSYSGYTNKYIFTTPPEIKFIKVATYLSDNITDVDVKFSLYKGTGTDDYYELVSIDDIKDELNEVSGKLTEKIGKYVITGNENITYDTSNDRFLVNNVIPQQSDKRHPTISNYFRYNATSKENGIAFVYYKSIYLYDRRFKDVDSYKAHLQELYNAGIPVEIYYILDEPQTIQLEPTEISTFEGTNNITLIDNIDTNINVNYEGQKHIHNISPDIVEKFTVGDTYKVSKVLFEAGVNKFEDGTDDDDILYLNSDNPYINKQTQINNILSHVKGFEINSFKTGKILGNPAVDPADLIKVEYNGIIYKTLAQYTLNFGGTMTSNYETTVEHEAKQSNVANKGFATKKFVKAELDNIDAKFSVEVGEINDGLSDLETNVTNTANRVSDTESKLNDTNSNLENLIGRTTKLEQDNQSWTFEFNNIYEDLTALNNKTNETDKTTKEIKDYIKFVDGNIILEGTDSKCSVVISKEKISFYTDGNESAFISNNELYITDNTVLNKQTIGKWEIKPDSEGNLNTRWIG